MDRPYFTIRHLTKELCVTARTLRYYEDEKLVTPTRRGITRIYSAQDRAKLIIILRGRRLGFSVTEMRDVARMYDYKNGNSAEMLLARAKFEERIGQLEQQKFDLEQALRQLRGCVSEIDAALQGQPRTPWFQFFDNERAIPASNMKV